MIRRILVALVLAGMMAGVLPHRAPARVPARQAMLELIDFEDLPIPEDAAGMVLVTDQYSGRGVTFNSAVGERYPASSGLAPSATKAIHQCESGQVLCNLPLVMTFAQPQAHVEVKIGFADSLPHPMEVRLTAYDAAIGGSPIASVPTPLGPSEGEVIPIGQLLEVTTHTNAIWRVEVGFSSASSLAPHLVFDDVGFARQELVGSVARVECAAATEAPTVTLVQPKPEGELVVPVNIVPLKGRVTTAETARLTAATLTTQGAAGTRTRSLIPDIIPENGGSFGELQIKNFLYPGTNTITLAASNCAGGNLARAVVDYQPSTNGTRFSLVGLEVTQTIQDLTNNVPLIADKRTFVRVFLATTNSTDIFSDVTANLMGCLVATPDAARCPDAQAFTALAPLQPVTVDSLADPADLVAKRKKLRNGLLFELPEEWRQEGYLQLWLDAASLSPSLPCDGCDNLGPDNVVNSYEFQVAPPLTIDLVDVTYRREGQTYTTSEKDRNYLLSWLRRAYPTSEVRLISDLQALSFDQQPRCQDVAQLMFEQWTSTQTEPAPDPWYAVTPTRYYGMVAAASDGAFMTGCALVARPWDEQERPDNDHFASGPAGFGIGFLWDLDGSYADFYGGHEIGHTYGRRHVALCGGTAHEDDKYPQKQGHISEKGFDYLGFDAGDGSLSLPTRVYQADRWHDVMTYCRKEWISAYTYRALLGTMNGEQPAVGDEPVVVESERPAPAQDDVSIDASPEPRDDVDADSTPRNSLLLLGTINMTRNTVDFKPFTLLPSDAVSPRNDTGEFRVVLRDRGEAVLATYRFDPSLYTDGPLGGDVLAQLGLVVPWNVDTGYIDIERLDANQQFHRIARRKVSLDPPEDVKIISPNGGERLRSTIVTVRWDGMDRNQDDLTYSLHYSADGGATWSSIVAGLRDKQYDVDLSRLASSDEALFRVIATDGVRTTVDESDSFFHVEPSPPDVAIISPADGTRLGTSQTIVLNGEARDLARGTLDDAALTWRVLSDMGQERTLGTGRSVSVADLPAGRHTITLSAKGDGGVTATAAVTIEIVDDEPEEVDWDPSLGAVTETPRPAGLFFYDNADEVGSFYVPDGEDQMQPLRTFDVLLNGWSAIVPGNFGGDDATDLLFYASDLGVGEFYASDGQGGLQLLSGNEGFTKGWDIIVPGDFDGQDDLSDLFFYDRAEGVGKFYTTDGAGRIRLLGAPAPLGNGWTSIVAGKFGGDGPSDLLFYDAATGLAQRYATDGAGAIEPLGDDVSLATGWDRVVAGNFAGTDEVTDLFLFNTGTGEAAFYITDGEGSLAPLGAGLTLPAGWSSVFAGNFGGGTGFSDLFFYDAAAGRGTFFASDGEGGLVELTSMEGLRAGWDVIVPGQFGGT